jgi:hypothetical protein
MKLNRLVYIIGFFLILFLTGCFSTQNGGYKQRSRSKKRCHCYTLYYQTEKNYLCLKDNETKNYDPVVSGSN